MGDSDDEVDKRNVREKFKHERNDYDRHDSRKNHDVTDSKPTVTSGRSRDRDSERSHRDKLASQPKRDSSPPPVKRVRRDIEDPGFRVPYGQTGFGQGSGDGHSHHSYGGFPQQGPPETAEFLTQVPMMSLKQFIAAQDENITDSEANKRYAEYRAEFRRQQIHEFFTQHKDEEWFRIKYHPDEYSSRQEEAKQILKHRCRVFMKLLELGWLSDVAIDNDHTNELVRILDGAVILMEGGTEFDLKAIDVDDETNKKTEPTTSSNKTPNNGIDNDGADDKLSDRSGDSADEVEHPKFTEPLRLGAESKPVKDGAVSDKKTSTDSTNCGEEKSKDQGETSSKKTNADKDENESSDGSLTDSDTETNTENKKPDQTSQPADASAAVAKSEKSEVVAEPKPRALHKTQSIFLRNLAPTITHQEVESVCKQYPGFLRVALQDPQPERRFSRRGWVTYTNDVNVKETCYNLNQIRLRECDMGAIVNRDLQQRIRTINGLTLHQQVAKSDIKNAAKIVQNFDNRWKMWDDATDKNSSSSRPSFGFVSNNPLMKNITDYLVDEGSFEEDILLGEDIDKSKDGNSEISFEKDKELVQVLDRLLLYLRIVYSFDYYSTVEYPHEDAMPHRCGIFHARGPQPRGKVVQHDLDDWLSNFNVRISPFVNLKITVEEEEIVKLGKKIEVDEIEKFITANAQELAKDKWLCPLSGKKFKGPEFVRKHILTKHVEKLDELKKDVVYFNTYLADPRRPQLPEHPTTRIILASLQAKEGQLAVPSGFHGPPPAVMGYRPPPMVYPGRRSAPVMYNPPTYHSRAPDHYRQDHFRGGNDGRSREPPRFAARRDRGRADPRSVISYNDLDAPADGD